MIYPVFTSNISHQNQSSIFCWNQIKIVWKKNINWSLVFKLKYGQSLVTTQIFTQTRHVLMHTLSSKILFSAPQRILNQVKRLTYRQKTAKTHHKAHVSEYQWNVVTNRRTLKGAIFLGDICWEAGNERTCDFAGDEELQKPGKLIRRGEDAGALGVLAELELLLVVWQ